LVLSCQWKWPGASPVGDQAPPLELDPELDPLELPELDPPELPPDVDPLEPPELDPPELPPEPDPPEPDPPELPPELLPEVEPLELPELDPLELPELDPVELLPELPELEPLEPPSWGRPCPSVEGVDEQAAMPKNAAKSGSGRRPPARCTYIIGSPCAIDATLVPVRDAACGEPFAPPRGGERRDLCLLFSAFVSLRRRLSVTN
jgi:hypothetical protein